MSPMRINVAYAQWILYQPPRVVASLRMDRDIDSPDALGAAD